MADAAGDEKPKGSDEKPKGSNEPAHWLRVAQALETVQRVADGPCVKRLTSLGASNPPSNSR